MVEKLKPNEVLKKKLAAIQKEYVKLPKFSLFGTNNHERRDAYVDEFNRLLKRPNMADIADRIDDLYEQKTEEGEDENPESIFDLRIRAIEWAIGRLSSDAL